MGESRSRGGVNDCAGFFGESRERDGDDTASIVGESRARGGVNDCACVFVKVTEVVLRTLRAS